MSKLNAKQTRSGKRADQDRPNNIGQHQPPRSPFRWAIVVLCVVAASAVAYYISDYYIFAKIPSELVGRWGVEGGPQDGATLEFFRNGSLVAEVNVHGRHGIIKSEVKVEGKSLIITSVHPQTGERKSQTQKITKMTNDELVLEDAKGTSFKMIRLN